MAQECMLTGKIARLAIFKVPEFGTRVSFQLECAGRASAVCAVDGDIAREFVKHYCEDDIVVVSGFNEPQPSTAAANTHGLADFAYATFASPKKSVSRFELANCPSLTPEARQTGSSHQRTGDIP